MSFLTPIPIKDISAFGKQEVNSPDVETLGFPLGIQANYCEISFVGDPGTYSGNTIMGYYTLCDQPPEVGTALGLPIYNGMNIHLQNLQSLRQFKAVAVTSFFMQIQYYNAR